VKGGPDGRMPKMEGSGGNRELTTMLLLGDKLFERAAVAKKELPFYRSKKRPSPTMDRNKNCEGVLKNSGGN